MLYRIVKLPVRIFGTKDVFYGIRFQPINSILAEMTGGDFAKWSRAGGCWVVVSEAGLERVNPGALIKPSQSMSALQHSRLRLPLANWQDWAEKSKRRVELGWKWQLLLSWHLSMLSASGKQFYLDLDLETQQFCEILNPDLNLNQFSQIGLFIILLWTKLLSSPDSIFLHSIMSWSWILSFVC